MQGRALGFGYRSRCVLPLSCQAVADAAKVRPYMMAAFALPLQSYFTAFAPSIAVRQMHPNSTGVQVPEPLAVRLLVAAIWPFTLFILTIVWACVVLKVSNDWARESARRAPAFVKASSQFMSVAADRFGRHLVNAVGLAAAAVAAAAEAPL